MDRFVNDVMAVLGGATPCLTWQEPAFGFRCRACGDTRQEHSERVAASVIPVIVFGPDGTEDVGRVVASHVTAADGLRGIGVPRAGAPPAIVEVGGVPVLFGPDGWELEGWTRPKPRSMARCLCPDAGASEVRS